MRRVGARAMLAIGVCLVSGIVHGCAVHVSPPRIPTQPADTTALGVRAELPLLAMWPGELRRIELPVVNSTPRAPRAYILRSDSLVSFRLDPQSARLKSRIEGAATTTPEAYVLHMDSLATPGDTTSVTYTVSTTTKPPRFSRWRIRVAVEMPLLIVDGFEATQNRVAVGPNPLHPTTTVRFSVPTSGRVVLEVYDVRGAHVATLVDQNLTAGSHTTTWNGRDERGVAVGSGVYFGRLTSPAGVRSYKMTVVK